MTRPYAPHRLPRYTVQATSRRAADGHALNLDIYVGGRAPRHLQWPERTPYIDVLLVLLFLAIVGVALMVAGKGLSIP